MSTPTNRGTVDLLAASRLPTNGIGQISATDVRAVIESLTTSAAFRVDNLSDISDAATARGNLGLGSAAVQDDDRYAHRANNLSDLANATTARGNLGLGSAATQADTRYAHRANNLSDLTNAATARANIGANDAANITIGTLADARLPTSQAGKTFTSPVQHASGTASLPGVTFAGDTDTGMFRPGVDTLAWATGGVERVRVDSAGNVGIGTTNPTEPLHIENGGWADLLLRSTNASTAVGGRIYLTNGNEVTQTQIQGAPGSLILVVASGERLRIDSSGNVGIGTSAPSTKLHVDGTVRFQNLPTTDPGVSGALWNGSGTLKVSA